MDPEILESSEVRGYKKGDIIIHQNDEADGLYVIKSGKVEVEMDGNKIAALEEGDFFGEMGVMLHQPRSATIRVVSEELSAHFLSREAFEKIKKQVGEEVIAKLLERVIENCKRNPLYTR